MLHSTSAGARHHPQRAGRGCSTCRATRVQRDRARRRRRLRRQGRRSIQEELLVCADGPPKTRNARSSGPSDRLEDLDVDQSRRSTRRVEAETRASMRDGHACSAMTRRCDRRRRRLFDLSVDSGHSSRCRSSASCRAPIACQTYRGRVRGVVDAESADGARIAASAGRSSTFVTERLLDMAACRKVEASIRSKLRFVRRPREAGAESSVGELVILASGVRTADLARVEARSRHASKARMRPPSATRPLCAS